MKKKLFFINPAWSHNIFKWWQYFFNIFFESYINNHWEPWNQFWIFKKLTPKKLIIIFKNFIAFYDEKELNIKKNDIVILGDIFTNTLCYTFKKWLIIYYSEYFNYKKSFLKKSIFFIIWYLFFYNRHFIVPTRLSEKSFLNLSKKVLYFPIIYYWEIYKNLKTNNNIISILFVWRMSQKFKNIDFLIENFLKLNKTFKIELNLVWKIFDSKYLNWNLNFLESNNINYLWEKTINELSEIYKNNDIFILPSNSDPIWAVTLEAMAHWCAIITSDTVGSSCYIDEWRNWLIFKNNDSVDLINSIKKLLLNNSMLNSYKKHSIEIIKSNFRYKNEALLKKKYENLTYFINN